MHGSNFRALAVGMHMRQLHPIHTAYLRRLHSHVNKNYSNLPFVTKISNDYDGHAITGRNTAILRTDLVGGLLAGTKTYKLDAILSSKPEDKQPKTWWVVGSPRGNHVVTAVAALRQRLPFARVRVLALGRPPSASSTEDLQGNELLLHMLLPQADIVPSRDFLLGDAARWGPAEAALATVLRATSGNSNPTNAVGINGTVCSFEKEHEELPIIWEGGAQPGGVRGAASLAPILDTIAQNKASTAQTAAGSLLNIAMDAGTGCTAAAVAVQLALIMRQRAITDGDSANTGVHLHVVLVAGSPEGFEQMLHQAASVLAPQSSLRGVMSCIRLVDASSTPSRIMGGGAQEMDPLLSVTLHRPSTARSFGAVNSTVASACVQLARSTGVLCDPVYTSKLLFTVSQLQREAATRSPGHASSWLVVHGGGAGGLLGHSAALSKAVQQIDGDLR